MRGNVQKVPDRTVPPEVTIMPKQDEILVAPCGMNCAYCAAYLNYKYGGKPDELHGSRGGCSGCRPRDKSCAFLKKKCDLLRKKKIQFCYECKDFPCEQLLKLDSRYEKKGWDVSFSGNNKRIKEIGLDAFIKEQKKKWSCPKCSGPISIHEKKCYKCGEIYA